MGLDTLDEFSPKDTDPVSLGDDVIRETRAATKQSFGLEHYLDGPHKIPQGAASVRPAAGRAGRLYYNTDTRNLEYDNGTQWMRPADRRASATILWHTSQIQITNSGQPFELPFDNVIDDPGGYANAQYHQIVMPANSICLATMFLQWDGPVGGGYGVIAAIEQYDTASSAWRPLVQEYNGAIVNVHYTNLTTIADSRWGTQLRCTVTNASSAYMYIDSTAIGASPRFAMILAGGTS